MKRTYLLLISLFLTGIQSTFSQATCDSAIEIANPLPFSAADLSNENGDSIGTTACGDMEGEDMVLKYTAVADSCILISFSNVKSYDELSVFEGCPTEGGICVKSELPLDDTASLELSVTAGVTYYFVYHNFIFTNDILGISVRYCSNGFSCDEPLEIDTIPFRKGNVSNCPKDWIQSTSCGNLYGGDVLFHYTADRDTCLEVSMDTVNNFVEINVFPGCPDTSSTCLVDGETPLFGSFILDVLNGQDYYILVSGGTISDGECTDSMVFEMTYGSGCITTGISEIKTADEIDHTIIYNLKGQMQYEVRRDVPEEKLIKILGPGLYIIEKAGRNGYTERFKKAVIR